MNAVREKRIVFCRTKILEWQHRDAFFLRSERFLAVPPIKPEPENDDTHRSDCGCDHQINASRRPRSPGCRSFSRLFCPRLPNRFRQLRISDTVPVEIDQKDRNTVLSGAFSQVM